MISKITEEMSKVVLVATPTNPLLTPLLHALTQQQNLHLTLLTRETTIAIPFLTHQNTHKHASSTPKINGSSKNNHSRVIHIETSFSDSELKEIFTGIDTIICALTGADIHLSSPLIAAAISANVSLFIPSEFGLDTSNPRLRALLPPYQTRFEIQEMLRKSGMRWKALYTGLVLEDVMRANGVLDLDVLWASVAVFPGGEARKVAVSTRGDVAGFIVDAVTGFNRDEGEGEWREEEWKKGFWVTLEDMIGVVEGELDRVLDRYEGDLVAARREAEERMKRGYFDGGVSLMSRVAVWDGEVGAWEGWREKEEKGGEWEEEVRRVVRMVKKGELAGAGCGC